jgi:type IV pilus assembly protein PilY1
MAYNTNARSRFSLRRALRQFSVVAATMSAMCSIAQTISDVPLVVKNNVAPNFMFMIDSSGSMNNIVPGGTAYSPTASYALPSWCTPARYVATANSVDIRIESSGTFGNTPLFTEGGSTRRGFGTNDSTYQRRCFNPSGQYLARLNANSTSSGARIPFDYLGARYSGHFLNWYFLGFDGGTANWTGDRKVVSTGTIRTRMEIAKSSAIDTLNNTLVATSAPQPANVRVGLSAYNSANGGDGGWLHSAMADYTTAKRTTMINAINNLSADGNTPLAETLADIGRYMSTGYSGNVSTPTVSNVNINNFLRQDGRQSCLGNANCATSTTDAVPEPATGTPSRPIQYWCQRSYTFLLTDGRPNGDQAFSNNSYLRDYDRDCTGANATACNAGGGFDRKNAPRTYEAQGSDYLDDVAKALFEVDLRPNLVAPYKDPADQTKGRQDKSNNLRTYTIAFDDADARNDKLLEKAAEQGGGLRIDATNETELKTGFRIAVNNALANSAAAAAVGVTNAQINSGDNTGFDSSYKSGDWSGNLEAYRINPADGLKLGNVLWSLSQTIDAKIASSSGFASRFIVSYNGTTGAAFTAANFPAVETLPGLVDFLRGDRSREGGAATNFRVRGSALGDIVNARAVVMNYPGNIPIVFQGANDGMLHVVDGRTDASVPTRGQELWAYVPRLVHGSLGELAKRDYTHRFYVDGTPSVAEVTGVGSVSRLLVGGLGKGGRGYYALNISSYEAATVADAAAKVMWEFGQGRANMGYSFGQPMIVRTAAGWRVLVTSGYDNGASIGGDGGGYIWVLDPATGNVLNTIATGVGSSANPSGLAHLSKMANLDANALVRYVHGGDLYGNVWRFDLDSNTATKIAESRDSASAVQSITSPVEVGPVSGTSSKLFVYVGTGRYFSEQDVPESGSATAGATQRQTIYGFIDNLTVATPSIPDIRGTNGSACPTNGGNGDLVCQTLTYNTGRAEYDASTNEVDTASKRGWYMDFPVDSRLNYGRVLGKPSLSKRGSLAFTVNIPKNERCVPGGSSWLFQLWGATGGAVPKSIPGTEYFTGSAVLLSPIALTFDVVRLSTAEDERILTRDTATVNRSNVAQLPTNSSPEWRRIYWRAVN